MAITERQVLFAGGEWSFQKANFNSANLSYGRSHVYRGGGESERLPSIGFPAFSMP
jgi:hypothetical protein